MENRGQKERHEDEKWEGGRKIFMSNLDLFPLRDVCAYLLVWVTSGWGISGKSGMYSFIATIQRIFKRHGLCPIQVLHLTRYLVPISFSPCCAHRRDKSSNHLFPIPGTPYPTRTRTDIVRQTAVVHVRSSGLRGFAL